MKRESMSIVKAVTFMFADTMAPKKECKKYFKSVFSGNLVDDDIFFVGVKGETLKLAYEKLLNVVSIDESILYSFIDKAYTVVELNKELQSDELSIVEKQKRKHSLVTSEALLALYISKLSDDKLDKSVYLEFKSEYKNYVNVITDIYLSDDRKLAIEKRKKVAKDMQKKYSCFNITDSSFESVLEEYSKGGI
ncbi:MAG: hypothetical protein N4A40_13210 [Tissierellales bacterium]|jgi:hypothetical protein|nr:hypothetical protein [Tissierellales bacterium]